MSRFCAALLAICLATPAFAAPIGPADLIQNGSFETGSFSGWARSGNTADTSVISQAYDGFSAKDGTAYAILGPVGSDGALSQSFATSPGSILTIDFWLANDGDLTNDFSARFDGDILVSINNGAAFGWTEFTATATSTGRDTLQFAFRNDPGYYALDHVSVTQTSPIPEPAGLLILPLGMLAIARVRRVRRHG